MKLLVVVSNYPHAGHAFSGIFNERSVQALKEYCDTVEVLAPRPYFPSLLSSIAPVQRWKAYAMTPAHERRDGISIRRPAYPQLPGIGASLWQHRAAFLFSRHAASRMHRRLGFDAILSFGLTMSGGIAWRLGRHMGIPAAGWATGSDIRQSDGPAVSKLLQENLTHLDLVFYQSRELFEIAERLTRKSGGLSAKVKHLVLPRGIPEPPVLPKARIRRQIRSALGVTADQVLVVYIGRVTADKGMFELVDAVSSAAAADPRVNCIIVGSKPAFDETTDVRKKIAATAGLNGKVKLLPECKPEKVWEYLCAADIFAFPSHNEGMPNSLLEAMAAGLPSIAFAIPPVNEIEAGTGALITVPALDPKLFSEAVLRLAASPDDRLRIGETAKAQVMDRFLARRNMAKALEQLEGLIQERKVSEPARAGM